MRQLTFIGTGKLEWWDVPAPVIRHKSDAIVRPLAVARCDLDYAMITGSAPLPGPFAFGHECAGEVVEIGDGVTHVQPGDKVIVPFQISCGTCDHCHRGWTNACLSVPRGAVFGMKPLCGEEFGGALSEFMHVPFADHMLVPLPETVRPAVLAGGSDNIADAWRTVAPYMEQYPGASVLVLGSGRGIGLYAVQIALAKGARRVLYAETGAGSNALRIAADMGADTVHVPDPGALKNLGQFNITVDASGSQAGLNLVVNSTAPCGTCTSISVFFDNAVPFPMTKMYTKGITFHTSRVQARTLLPTICNEVTCGQYHPEIVTSREVSFSEAIDAMDDPGPKVVFTNDWV
ncbi:MAG: dehydrogenase [Rhodobiaceae bacterium]|nr:dehydrogenase [Rhodobiaceae bacterium]